VAEKKDLPHVFIKENQENIPVYAVLVIAGIGSLLAVIGSLGSLVDAASIIFLFTFGVVNFIAFRQKVKYHWVSLIASIGCGLAIVTDITINFEKIPYSITGLIVISALIFITRPYLLKRLSDV